MNWKAALLVIAASLTVVACDDDSDGDNGTIVDDGTTGDTGTLPPAVTAATVPIAPSSTVSP